MEELARAPQRLPQVMGARALALWEDTGRAGLGQPGEGTTSVQPRGPTADTRVIKELELGSSQKLGKGGQETTGVCWDKKVSGWIWGETFSSWGQWDSGAGWSESCALSLEGVKSQLDQAVNRLVSPHTWPCFGLWGGLEISWHPCKPHLSFGTTENKDMHLNYSLILYCEIKKNDTGNHRITGA